MTRNSVRNEVGSLIVLTSRLDIVSSLSISPVHGPYEFSLVVALNKVVKTNIHVFCRIKISSLWLCVEQMVSMNIIRLFIPFHCRGLSFPRFKTSWRPEESIWKAILFFGILPRSGHSTIKLILKDVDSEDILILLEAFKITLCHH